MSNSIPLKESLSDRSLGRVFQFESCSNLLCLEPLFIDVFTINSLPHLLGDLPDAVFSPKEVFAEMDLICSPETGQRRRPDRRMESPFTDSDRLTYLVQHDCLRLRTCFVQNDCLECLTLFVRNGWMRGLSVETKDYGPEFRIQVIGGGHVTAPTALPVIAQAAVAVEVLDAGRRCSQWRSSTKW